MGWPALLTPKRCGSTTRIRSPYSNITSDRRVIAVHSCSFIPVASIVAPSRRSLDFRCEKRTAGEPGAWVSVRARVNVLRMHERLLAPTHDDGRAPPGRHLDRVAPDYPDEHRVPIGLVVLLVRSRLPDTNANRPADRLRRTS
jgi:hypothetical protein